MSTMEGDLLGLGKEKLCNHVPTMKNSPEILQDESPFIYHCCTWPGLAGF